MLRSLYVKDYALIEELEVEFDSGLNIITGETGAGKSILIGALSMILGDRASMDTVRSGAKKAVIEGIFDEAEGAGLNDLLEVNAIDPMPQIILRRQITSTQSRAFINDTPATLDVMRAVAAELIDLHGQHEHQSLLRTERHREMLDSFGGLGSLRGDYQQSYRRVQNLVDERDELRDRERELEQQRELYEFQLQEINRVDPQEGEEESLENERRVLANAEQLHASSAHLYEMLFESDDAVHDQLVVARNELQDLARIDDAFDELLGEIQSAQIIVSETASFLQDYNARIAFDPQRLSAIRERMADLERLKRKYGGTMEAVLERRREIREQHELANDFEGALNRVEQQIQEAQQELSLAAKRLSKKRGEVAERIERAIVEELSSLGMPHSRFEVRFSQEPSDDGWILLQDDPGKRLRAFEHGMDQVEFFLSTNVGEELMPLTRVASGGEVSRIMLALKTILAKSERLPILVFDEIDTGISGGIARRVGESMKDLADYHQIIAITHLPQIAALGDVHFKVEKQVEEQRTKTRMRRLSDEGHTAQVARLISGRHVTDAALDNARELIAGAAAAE